MGRKRSVLLFLALFLLSFAIAAHIITTQSGIPFNFNEDTFSIYNITVNNSDTLNISNITEVSIALPSEIIFFSGSNGTTTGSHIFSNTTSTLTWQNDGLVMNNTSHYFWFNATSNTPGIYNITVSTTNATGQYDKNLTVEINDTTDPHLIEIVSPLNDSILKQNHIQYNITADDNGIIDSIILRLYNSANTEINSSLSSISPVVGNFTSLLDGIYYINATVNDTYGNQNSSSTIQITLDTTNPNISFSCSASSVDVDEMITCSCSGNDTLSGVESTTYTQNPSTSSAGDYSTTCTIIDYAGNSVESSIDYTVLTSTSNSGNGGIDTFKPSELEIFSGYKRTLYKNWKIEFPAEGDSHLFKVEDIIGSTMKFSVSSEYQEATLIEGESININLDGDEDYDLNVKLISIENKNNKYYIKANVELKFIDEKIEEATIMLSDSSEDEKGKEITRKSNTETNETSGINQDKKSNFWPIILTVLVILLISFSLFNKNILDLFNRYLGKKKKIL
jgi:hypothetical protein